jgi:hypothetical protein
MLKLTAAAFALSLFSTVASAATFIESFNVDVRSAAGTESTIALVAGRTYELTVSGRFTLGNNARRHISDAEYFNLGSTPLAPIKGNGLVGLDGTLVDFGDFNPSSVYTTRFVGDGTTINVFVQDSRYNDNGGSLQASISAIPLPAGAVLLISALAGLGFARRRKAA